MQTFILILAIIRGAGLQPAFLKQPKGLRPIVVGFFSYIFLSSTVAYAGDPFVEKQRLIQQELYERFTALDRKFNGEKKTLETAAKPVSKPLMQKPQPLIDNIAFPDGIRDPFAIPSVLLQTLVFERNSKEKNSAINYNFSRNSQLPLPKIKLKGVMHQKKDESPLAIVLLNDETYMVREGDEIGFNIAEPSQVIKIKKIKRLSVLVAIGTLGELVIVR